ncbi:hypothetical protein AcV5_008414 [Taiwanofungus camphoratus]|nr:hypothetical protein AcV5_008414 [Antrodia cinnamomea]
MIHCLFLYDNHVLSAKINTQTILLCGVRKRSPRSGNHRQETLLLSKVLTPRMSKFLESWYYMAVSFPDNLHCDMVVYRVRYKGMAHEHCSVRIICCYGRLISTPA